MKERAELVLGGLRKAQSDSVALDATQRARALDAAWFHAQQATEKYLKAFLAHHDDGKKKRLQTVQTSSVLTSTQAEDKLHHEARVLGDGEGKVRRSWVASTYCRLLTPTGMGD